jgi:hypothetical protein
VKDAWTEESCIITSEIFEVGQQQLPEHLNIEAYCHPELDAPEIVEVLDCPSEHKPSVFTTQRILRSKGLNRPKGQR